MIRCGVEESTTLQNMPVHRFARMKDLVVLNIETLLKILTKQLCLRITFLSMPVMLAIQSFSINLDFCHITLEFAQVNLVFEPKPNHISLQRHQSKAEVRFAYISSISAGVRRATSGRMNQAAITAKVPEAAKLQ